jgi:hypothetical protein
MIGMHERVVGETALFFVNSLYNIDIRTGSERWKAGSEGKDYPEAGLR